tara:strand:+ start:304 stop:447 length:144 start_codon:yes stop_codon:yes gene_type:complete
MGVYELRVGWSGGVNVIEEAAIDKLSIEDRLVAIGFREGVAMLLSEF